MAIELVSPPTESAATKDVADLRVLTLQRTCVHDGPGIRTVMFFRGCNMRCKWCHNPEAQSFRTTAGHDAGTPIAELLRLVARDKAYYRTTHGGVTLSGGEPLLQPATGLARLLAGLKEEEIHVAVETAGDAPWRAFAACLPYVDLFLFDLKVVGDDDLHQQLTGRPFRPIRENIERLLATDTQIKFRMCVVPGLNDAPGNLEATADLLRSFGRPSLELLRYYNLHEAKARRLGLAQAPLHIDNEQSVAALARAAEQLRSFDIEVEYVTPHAARPTPAFSQRVHDIQQAIRDAGHQVCLESATLKTVFHKQHGFAKPPIVQRAELLRYLLNHKQVIVYPGELLVGNFTAKRVAGNVWVEYFGTVAALVLWQIDRQTPVSFACSRVEKLHFYRDIFPFWIRHGLIAHLFASPRELLLFAARMVEKKVAFQNNMAGIAHFIVNCERLLQLGTTGIAEEVEAKRSKSRGQRRLFYDSILIALKALEEFAERYAQHLHELSAHEADEQRRAELLSMAEVCRRVPKHPARSFHEALQSILFVQIALCTESFENAISLGRLDQVLQPYYEADRSRDVLDYETARELLACFILKMDEIIFLNDGDTGFKLGRLFESLSPVETVTIGGVDRDGRDCSNDVTFMILDVCELRPIGVNMAARIHPGSPDAYVERIAEVYVNGSPMPALYNDAVYIRALRHHYPTPLADARDYAIVGCVEPVASNDHFGNTDCANINVTMPFLQALKGEKRSLWKYGALGQLDGKLHRLAETKLPVRLRSLLRDNGAPTYDPPASMAELMERFRARTNELVAAVLADHAVIETALAENLPTPLASALFPGCIETGKDVYQGGTTYNSSGIQAVGITDVADSLSAIDEVVYRKKLFSIAEVIRAIDENFAGEDNQRIRDALLAVPKFGNDDAPEAHTWVNRVLGVYVDALSGVEHRTRKGMYSAGYYGLNVNMVYGANTPALPSGRLNGVPLANSVCPHYGMQMVDLTSSLNAIARVEFDKYAPNGTTHTPTIDAGLFPGETGRKNLAGLIRGFFEQGGMQLQPNLLSREILLDAYDNPGKYKNLVVRIAGYCAYFNDLSDELKREIINRTFYAGPDGPSGDPA